jgi:outer membrane receptor protein involved in Fe transport
MPERIAMFCLVAAVYLLSAVANAEQTSIPTPSAVATTAARSAKPSGAEKHRLREMVVYGAAPEPYKTDLSSDRGANPASVTTAKYPAEIKRATTSYGELLRPLTGVTIDNYGQGGIGYGISIRGFDQLEHGRDVATFVDGVPQNQTSSIQVNGYTDLNDLNPELINRIVLTRGPNDVRAGDYAIGGSVNFSTLDSPASGVTITGGEFGGVRGNAVYSAGSGSTHGFVSLMVDDNQGYSHNGSLMRINSFNKLLFPLLHGEGALRFQFFNDTFGAPGYINRVLVSDGKLGSTAAINATDGGNRTEENLVFNYREPNSDRPLSLNLYAIHNAFNRFATFSTVPISPNQPGQAWSLDRRYTLGGNGEKYMKFALPGSMAIDVLAGAGLRSDLAQAAQYSTIARVPTSQTIDVDFNIHNPFAYAQIDFKPYRWLKLTGGVRYDEFFYAIHDVTNAADTSPETGAFQPKGGLTLSPIDGFDIFANIGQGIRSPSAVFDLNLNPHIGVTTVTSEEVGVQYNSPGDQWHFLGSAYTSRLTNEIQQNPPPQPSTNLGPSRRRGFDLEAGYRLLEAGSGISLSLLASYSALEARLIGNPQGQYVPNTPNWLAKYGGELRWPLFGPASRQLIFIYANQQFVGESSLNPQGTERAGSYSRFNIVLSYSNLDWDGLNAFFEATAYPFGRFNETAVSFGNGTIGISPKAPVTAQAGIHLPLNFLPATAR